MHLDFAAALTFFPVLTNGVSTESYQAPCIFHWSRHHILVQKCYLCSLTYAKHINLDAKQIKMLSSILGQLQGGGCLCNVPTHRCLGCAVLPGIN